jgi:hypothetical protein
METDRRYRQGLLARRIGEASLEVIESRVGRLTDSTFRSLSHLLRNHAGAWTQDGFLVGVPLPRVNAGRLVAYTHSYAAKFLIIGIQGRRPNVASLTPLLVKAWLRESSSHSVS